MWGGTENPSHLHVTYNMVKYIEYIHINYKSEILITNTKTYARKKINIWKIWLYANSQSLECKSSI